MDIFIMSILHKWDILQAAYGDHEEATASESKEVVLLKEIRDGINNLTKS